MEQNTRIVVGVAMALKFLVFALWYRCCNSKGNIHESTSCLYWCRMLYDLPVYAYLAYAIYLEKNLEGEICYQPKEGVVYVEPELC